MERVWAVSRKIGYFRCINYHKNQGDKTIKYAVYEDWGSDFSTLFITRPPEREVTVQDPPKGNADNQEKKYQ
jgi:hypothetical protein